MNKQVLLTMAAAIVSSSALFAYVDPYGVEHPDQVPAQQTPPAARPYGSGPQQSTTPQQGPNPAGQYYDPQSPYDWPNYGNQQGGAGQPDRQYEQRGEQPNRNPNPTPGGYYQERGSQQRR